MINSFISEELTKIKANKQLTDDKIDEQVLRKLGDIRDRVLKLKVIYIELDQEDDAYVIFETLNTRGKDLSVADLVKNYITKYIKSDNKGVDIPKDKWNDIRENIEGPEAGLDLDTFLLHVWLSKYDYTTIKTLFKKIKVQIKSPQAKSFLNSLVVDSETYRAIFDPEVRKWQRNDLPIKQSLTSLYRFGVTQQTPMVLSIMREFNSGKLRYKYAFEALEAIEHFHYIFTAITSQRSSGGISTMYSTYGRKLFASKDDSERLAVIRELKQKMREKLPTYDEFFASFKTVRFDNSFTKQKKIIQYTLSKIDKFYNKSGSSVNYDLMTIEHLLPQNPKDKTKISDNACSSIGNLILVDEQTNNKLANKDFSQKKQILSSTNIFLDSVLTTQNHLSPTEISDRTELIASLAYNEVFKI